MGDVLNVLPFANNLVSYEITGAALRQALEHAVANAPESSSLYPHVAGIRFAYDPSLPVGERVQTVVTDAGETLDDEATYVLVTSEFLAAGGDDFTMLEPTGDTLFWGDDAQALADWLETNPQLSAEPAGRVVVGAELIPATGRTPAWPVIYGVLAMAVTAGIYGLSRKSLRKAAIIR
jgi:5'-nucleotidase